MSCQAGIWNFDGKPVDRVFLARLGASILQYGPDGADEYGRGGPGEYVHGNVAMIYRPYSTNKESRLERQPYVTYNKDTGEVRNVMTWDGRLDNRDELIRALSYELDARHKKERKDSSGNGVAATYTDVAIVMAAWEAWGTECFKRLIGDFCVAVWNHDERTLTLAKDFVGVKYLYYEILPEGARGGERESEDLRDAETPRGPSVWWCSRLEPLILLSGRQYDLNGEYVAGYFTFHPANRLTPYVGVDALPAGHYVQIRNGQKELVQYWHFDPDKRIQYKSNSEYEEHFRHLFFQSLKRRLRADAPVVAGLSGGRDSSAIVCVADELIARGEVETPHLDTFSRYAEGEPFQDDHRYLVIVEQKRGRTGHHLVSNSKSPAAPSTTRRLRPLEMDCFAAHPGVNQRGAEGMQNRMDFMKAHGYRVILAGIGGDEVTGGVPNCISGLADLLVQGHLVGFMKQLRAWSLAQKRTWPNLLWNTLKSVEPGFARRMVWNESNVRPWVAREFIAQQLETFRRGIRGPGQPRKGLPSFRTNVGVISGVSWQLACTPKVHRQGARENGYDRGFPFLDRDFLEFMFAIPREQVLRPGRYRSLMRRALAGIVPDEILNRTRKAFAIRHPALGMRSMAAEAEELFAHALSAELGYIAPGEFLAALSTARDGLCEGTLPLERTISLEMWLQSLSQRHLLKGRSESLIEERGYAVRALAS
jgi:asparagine synthase (glutamine-hydrolysing)